jgi:hypothetical protein
MNPSVPQILGSRPTLKKFESRLRPWIETMVLPSRQPLVKSLHFGRDIGEKLPVRGACM